MPMNLKLKKRLDNKLNLQTNHKEDRKEDQLVELDIQKTNTLFPIEIAIKAQTE